MNTNMEDVLLLPTELPVGLFQQHNDEFAYKAIGYVYQNITHWQRKIHTKPT